MDSILAVASLSQTQTPKTGDNKMKKAQFLQHFGSIEPNQPVNPEPVAYKHKGSTYDQDGIRITGSRPFIDSVLSRLKDLLSHENGSTRLQVNYQQSADRKTGILMDSWNCYIQVHERGSEAKMVNAYVSGLIGKDVIPSRGW